MWCVLIRIGLWSTSVFAQITPSPTVNAASSSSVSAAAGFPTNIADTGDVVATGTSLAPYGHNLPTRGDPSCVWPQCAPTCEFCPPHEVGMCFMPHFRHCVSNSTCHMGVCLCHRGFCPGIQICNPLQCQDGAYPPPYVATEWVQRLTSYGPPLPPLKGVTTDDWVDYAKKSMKYPMAMLGLGAVVALLMFGCMCAGSCIFKDHHDKCPPIFVILWLLITIGCIVGVLVVRHSQVMRTFDLGVHELVNMHQVFVNAATMGNRLNADFQQVKTSIDTVPSSCSVSLAKDVMGKGVDGANQIMEKMFEEIDKFNNAIQPIPPKLQDLIDFSGTLRHFFMWLPCLPLAVMLVVSVLMTLGTICLHTEAAQTAECCMSRLGSGGIVMLIVLAVGVGALQLEAAMVSGGFCSNVDAHVVGLIDSKQFLKEEHGKTINMTKPVHKAARYYIYGNERNPFLNFLADCNYTVGMMQRAMDKVQKGAKLAEKTCPQISNVYTARAFAGMQDSITQGEQFMLAESLWPYYNSFVHELLCRDFVDSEAVLVFYTMGVALFIFPVLVILVEARLESERQSNKEVDDEHDNHFVNSGNYHPVADKGQSSQYGGHGDFRGS